MGKFRKFEDRRNIFWEPLLTGIPQVALSNAGVARYLAAKRRKKRRTKYFHSFPHQDLQPS